MRLVSEVHRSDDGVRIVLTLPWAAFADVVSAPTLTVESTRPIADLAARRKRPVSELQKQKDRERARRNRARKAAGSSVAEAS